MSSSLYIYQLRKVGGKKNYSKKSWGFRIFKDFTTSELEKSNSTGLLLGYSTTSLTVKEDSPLYPFSSLFGDIGGSLGLFVGFSLLTFGETIIDSTKYCFGYLSK